jgi:glucosamine--fructose-6-phosphate aminotransferase (isomerizing)
MRNELLLNEIDEQPRVIEGLIKHEKKNIQSIIFQLKQKFNYIIIAARGSSDNAARYAQYLFGAHNSIQVALATPSLFTLYQKPPNMSGALVIGISQSGQSPDIVAVLSEAQKQGCPALSITNGLDSPLAKVSDFCIPLHIGKELATAATKSYTSSLVSLAIFSSILNSNKAHISELDRLPDQIHQTIYMSSEKMKNVQRYRFMEEMVVIGRGFNYATSFEIALKVKELTRVVALAYSSADFKHGPIATVHSGFPLIMIAPSGKTSMDIKGFIQKLRSLGAELILISNEKELLKNCPLPFEIPSISEWLSPILCVVPGQMFARQLAIEKRFNPDHPEGLTKVTETF